MGIHNIQQLPNLNADQIIRFMTKFDIPTENILTTNEKYQTFFEVVDENNTIQEMCWEWISSLYDNGYGRFSVGQYDRYVAHRISYFLYYKSDPGNMLVMHLCNNKQCINPHHLQLGSHNDNMIHAIETGQSTFGSKNPASILTEEKVVKILQGICDGTFYSCEQIADHYDLLDGKTIRLILNGKNWKHVTSKFPVPLIEIRNKIMQTRKYKI